MSFTMITAPKRMEKISSIGNSFFTIPMSGFNIFTLLNF